MTHQNIFDQAVSHHQASRLEPAERLYRQIIAADPNHVDALHMLGVVVGQRGQLNEAVESLAGPSDSPAIVSMPEQPRGVSQPDGTFGRCRRGLRKSRRGLPPIHFRPITVLPPPACDQEIRAGRNRIQKDNRDQARSRGSFFRIRLIAFAQGKLEQSADAYRGMS